MTPSLLARCAALLLTILLLLVACTQESVSADLNVDFLGAGGGRVVVDAPGSNTTDYESAFSRTFPAGTEVTLAAVPDETSEFTGWDGDCGGAGDCRLTLDTAKTASATFAKRSFALTLQRTGPGTLHVTADGAELAVCPETCEVTFEVGTVVTLKAVADSGAAFASWSGACAGTGGCVVTMSGPQQVNALFEAVGSVQDVTLTAVPLGAGRGSVTSDPPGIDCGVTCSDDFPTNMSVTLRASATAGSTFAGWFNCPARAVGDTCVFTPTAKRQVTAVFNLGAAQGTTTLLPVRQGSDDAEQYLTEAKRVPREKGDVPYEDFVANAVDIESGDLDLTYNSDYVDVEQLVGLRFSNLSIPPGATILDARIQFTVDHPTGGYIKLIIYGQADPQALTFVHQKVGDISDRPRTANTVVWEPPAWESEEGTVNDPAALTPNLAAIVQEVVSAPGWQKRDNGLVFIIAGDPANGSNRRRAVSFEDSDTKARLLVTYGN